MAGAIAGRALFSCVIVVSINWMPHLSSAHPFTAAQWAAWQINTVMIMMNAVILKPGLLTAQKLAMFYFNTGCDKMPILKPAELPVFFTYAMVSVLYDTAGRPHETMKFFICFPYKSRQVSCL